MIRPSSLDVSISWNRLDNPTTGVRRTVPETLAYFETTTLAEVKAKLRRDNNGVNPRNISAITKFSATLMTVLNIRDGKDAKVFSNLQSCTRIPYKVARLIGLLYDIYRDIVPNGNLPPIPGIPEGQYANCDRDVIAGLEGLDSLPQRTVTIYAYTVAFYLHWAQLNGSWPSNRYYDEAISEITTMEQNPIPGQPPSLVRVVRARNINRLAAKNPSPYLCNSFFKYYDLAVNSGVHDVEECTICMEPMTLKNNNLKLNECGHFFHAECLAKCPKAECPICKHPIPRTAHIRAAPRAAPRAVPRAVPRVEERVRVRRPNRFMLDDSD